MAKERRCNLFDDNGKPRRMKDGTKGCSRDASACHFVHPHEREWKTAHPSFPPKHDAVADSDSDFYYILAYSNRPKDRDRDREKEKEKARDRDRDKDRDRRGRDKDKDKDRAGRKERERESSSSFHHRGDSTTTHASPGPSSRRLTSNSAMDVDGIAERGRSPASPTISTSSGQLAKLRTYKKLSFTSRDSPPLASRRSRSPRDRVRDRERTGLPSKPPPAACLVPDTRATDTSIAQHLSALPPEPPKPPPVQPAPPPPQIPEVPKLPSFVSNQRPTGSMETTTREQSELSLDEQRSVWHERIDLMFTSVTSRRDYTKLESDLSQIRLLANSSIMNNMPEADRARINAQRMALELQMDVKHKEISETIQKLIGSSFWPVLRSPQILEMEKTLGETKRHVLEVRSLLDDMKSSCAALFKTSASDWTQDSDRPTKRRKLEGEGDSLGQSTGENAEDTTEDTAAELEAFRDKLTELDRHLIDLENDITQRDQIVSDEIELHIDARLEEEALYPPIKEPTEVSQTEIETIVNAKNQEIVHAVTTTGEEIEILAVEVAELIMKVDALEVRCIALEAENQEFKNKLAQDALEHANSQGALMRRDREIDAIAAALQAYISQTPTSQAAGDLPSAEYIIESLDSQLDVLFREKFSAILVNLQQEVFDKVQESHNRTLDIVSPKIMLLLRMVNLITARLGKPDIDVPNTG